MNGWARVKWAEAGQVGALGDIELGPGERALPPFRAFELLVERGELDEAAAFLGVALPRYEAVAWAAGSLSPEQAQTVSAWLADPTEQHRRDAGRAAEHADDAPRLAALAAFFSGGSIAPEDLPAVQPAPEICGKLAAAAVLAIAHAAPEPEAALRAALARGSQLADTGVDPAT